MRVVGRWMQIAGLIILPLAMFLELNEYLGRDFYLSDMLLMLGFGLGLFSLGRYLEGYSRAPR